MDLTSKHEPIHASRGARAWDGRIDLTEILRHAPAFMAVLRGPENVFEMANEAFLRLVGRRDVVGVAVRQALPDLDSHGLVEVLDRVYAGGEPLVAKDVTVRLRPAPDRPPEERMVEFACQPLRDGSGTVTGVLVHGVDLTDRRRAEASLKESAGLLRTISETTGDAIFAKDRRGRLTYANPATLALVGKPASGVLGRADVEFLEDKDAARQVMANDARIMSSGVAEDIEEVVPLADGTRRVWFSRKVPFRDGDGNVIGLLGVSRDITDRREVEEEAKQTKRKLNAALIAGEVGTFEWDIENQRVGGDANFARMFGVTLDADGIAPLADYVDVMHPDDQQRVRERIALTVETGIDYQIEYRVVSGGMTRWLLVRAKPETDKNGRVVRAAGVCLDITDRKLAEEALRLTQASIDGAAEMVAWFTPDGSVHYVNDATCRTLGYSRDELLKMTALDFSPGFTKEQYREHWDEVRRRKSFTVQPVHQRKDGSQYTAEVLVNHVVYGGREYIFAYGRDITERKRAEEALRDSEHRLRQMADAMPQIVWVTRPDGQHEYFNRRWYEFTGLEAGAADGDDWTGLLHPEDRDELLEVWRRSLVTGEPYEVEYRLRRHDGEYRWLLGRALAVRDGAGRILRWIGTSTDVHDAKLAREELKRAKEEAEAASRTKDHLLAVVSHELRTPLNPVLAITSYLSGRPDLPAELREDIDTIRRNVEQEARIVDDLLSVTRLRQGKIVLHPEAVDLHALIRAAVAQCGPDSDAKEIDLLVSLRAKPSHIWADSGRLQQVLSNLLGNAVKFTPRGGRVTVRTSATGGGRVRLEVEDTGVGIDPEVLPKLFTPFEQGGATVARQFGGLGLGLVIVKGIVDLHGGTVTARSDGPGRGTSFAVELAAVAAPEDQTCHPHGEGAVPAVKGLRVLLVEDHPDTLRVMARLLVTLGYGVITASSVAEAVRKVESEDFDLLVSDIGLPDGSGLDVVRALQRQSGVAKRAIALSGFGHADDIRRSREAGFAEHLVKPVSFQSLDRALRQLVNGGFSPKG